MDARKLVARLRVEGLSIEAGASKWMLQWLDIQPNPVQALDVVLQQLPKATLHSSVLTTDILNSTISGLRQDVEGDVKKHTLVVIPTTVFPMLRYNFSRHAFAPASDEEAKRALHGDAKDKIGMFRYRLGLIRQRMLRRETFATPVLRSGGSSQQMQLTPIDSLLGSTGERNVLGMLAQLQEGKWYLEDQKGSILLDLTKATRSAGLFTEGVIVIAQGEIEEDRFVVRVLGMPLPEKREESLKAFPNLDFFGAAPPPKLMAESASEDIIVVLTDVYLDRPEIMHALRRLFDGFDPNPPRAFVLIGNFSSRGVGHASEDSVSFRAHWDQLADLILQHKGLSHPRDGSEFIFVPGPGDPCGAVLPRPPIPSHFTKYLRERVPQVTFTTNPCRIRYCSQEIVIFREDLMARMLRHVIVRPTDETTQSHHLVKTLVDQGHLCPLPLTVRPIHWQLDYTLHLWPLPDMVILADQYEQFQTDYSGCQCVTVMSFATDLSFLTYIPATRTREWSRLPSEEEEEAAAQPAAEAPEPAPKKVAAKKAKSVPVQQLLSMPAASAPAPQQTLPKKPKSKKKVTMVLPPPAATDDRPPPAMNGNGKHPEKQVDRTPEPKGEGGDDAEMKNRDPAEEEEAAGSGRLSS